MIDIPPAVIGVLHLLPTVIGWPLGTYATLYAIQDLSGISLPLWAIVIVSVLAHPLSYRASYFLQQRRDERNAAQNGAITAPRVEGGEFALLKQLMDSSRSSIPGSVFHGWSKKYGNVYRLRVSGEERLFTTEPEHIKAILATQFNSFKKGPTTFAQFKELLGFGVFATDDDMWKFHRTMTRPFFSRDRISDFDIFDRHAAETVSAIKERLAEGYPVEFQDVVARFTLDSATEFLFGHDVRSLDAGLPYPEWSNKPNPPQYDSHPSNSFVRAFVKGQDHAADRTRRGNNWRLFEPFRDELRHSRKIIDDYTMPILKEALAKKGHKEEKKSEDEGETFLDHLVSSTAGKHGQFWYPSAGSLHTRTEPQVIADSIVNILVAGRDTTAATLTFALYMLAEHPDVAKKLRDEILDKVGPDARPDYDNIRDMKYLRAFLNETLRLFPAVPFNGRTTIEPVLLPPPSGSRAPIYVPAGTRCGYSVFLMHRRKDLWGPDALEFDPDRFIDHRLSKYLSPNPFIFTPFNAGPRICLGQQFAYNEMSFFLVRLMQSFSSFSLEQKALKPVETPEQWKGEMDDEKVAFQMALTMSVKDGLWMNMKQAGSDF